MYEIARYVGANDLGTAVLLEAMIGTPVKRIVVASSMSVYGEGLYRSVDGVLKENVFRGGRNLDGSWDPLDEQGRPLRPVPTPETKPNALQSIYAIGKFVQERMTLTLTRQYGMEGTALRLWNVYGPGQALSNPYTGVLAIFASRIAHGEAPLIFEDGMQRRDFVHVADVARAFRLALDHPLADGEVFNIASGENRTIEDVARLQAASMGRADLRPEITGKARAGDIRHCIPDLTKATRLLGHASAVPFGEGLEQLAEWVALQESEDRVAQARAELELHGLVA
jgi:dTDP-L-rhamnose 4-epimerase